MDEDLRRQLVTVLTYVITVVVNAAAVLIPLGGSTTAELSDRFPVLVTPANYVFGILERHLICCCSCSPSTRGCRHSRTDPALRRLGYLPALTGFLNASWVLLWQYQVFALTVPVMLGLLVTLIASYLRLRQSIVADSPPGLRLAGRPAVLGVPRIGCTVATIANISQMLYHAGYRGAPIGEDAWAAIVLTVGLGIAVAMLMRHRDVAFAAVIVWAYLGIGAKQWDATGAALIAVACAVVVAVLADPRHRTAVPGAAGPALGWADLTVHRQAFRWFGARSRPASPHRPRTARSWP